MKRILIVAIAIGLLFFSSCRKDVYSTAVTPVGGVLPKNANHPMKDSLEIIINKHLAKGVPGVQVMVKNADGWYIANAGYAKLETKTPIEDNMTAWVYSISKTYLAVVALRLKEKGMLNLDAKISSYLSQDVIKHLANADKITVRQLMNHSSGLRNHTVEPSFQLFQLNLFRKIFWNLKRINILFLSLRSC